MKIFLNKLPHQNKKYEVYNEIILFIFKSGLNIIKDTK